MSIEALNWALTQMQLTSMPTSTRFVLMILANRAAPEGECWPSHQYIQDRTGLSNETVRTACKNLEEAGLLTITPRVLENGRKTSNHYQLNLGEGYPQPLGVPTPQQLGGVPPTIGGKTKDVYEGGSKEPISYTRKAGKADPKPAWQASDAELIRLVEEMGRSTIGKSRDELIRILGEQPIKRVRAA